MFIFIKCIIIRWKSCIGFLYKFKIRLCWYYLLRCWVWEWWKRIWLLFYCILVGWFYLFRWIILILIVCDVWSFVSKFFEIFGFSMLVVNWNREGEYSVKVIMLNYKNSDYGESNNKDNDCSMMIFNFNGVYNCS